MQASSLREVIAQNPGACAAVGYAVGTMGYQALSGCNLNPFVTSLDTDESTKREFGLIGVQSMGASAYAYRDICAAPLHNDKACLPKSHAKISVGKLHNAARAQSSKKTNHTTKIKRTAKEFAIEKRYTKKTDEYLETITYYAHASLDPDRDFGDKPYNIARFAKTKESRYTEDSALLSLRHKTYEEYVDESTDEFGINMVFDLKAIAIGLATSATFYTMAVWSAQEEI